MDLSALIFVALAVAWAVYLIPKALRHHEEDAVSRSVESFSGRMRVLARREAVSADRAELVVSSTGRRQVLVLPDDAGAAEEAGDKEPAADATDGIDDTQGSTAVPAPALPLAQRRARREVAARAARRRRRVLLLLLLANAVVTALAATEVILWPYVAIPATLLVAWLVACRLMVRRERAARATVPVRAKSRSADVEEPVAQALAAEDAAVDVATEGFEDTDEIPPVTADAAAHDGWDPVPVTLPTYVAKAPAGRTVRTIDLDATGVWSSGRSAADSELARQADEAAKAGGTAEERRATGT